MTINGRLEVLAERQACLLFDRMVAFHIQRGLTAPLGAAEFYAGLRQRYSERVAQEDADLLMVYDNASMRMKGNPG